MMGAPAGTPLPELPPKTTPPPLPGLGSAAPAPAAKIQLPSRDGF
jgi:hypothetical protein